MIIKKNQQNAQVGKTSLMRRFCKGVFTEDYKMTIGVDFMERSLCLPALG